MNLKISKVKQKLKNGEACFGTMLRILKSPQAVPMCASEGWDYVLLDTEHNDYDYETLGNFCALAKYEEMALFVRVPDKLYHQMAQMLDIGAEGLVLPQVKTREETERIIRSTKYAPLGKRGVSISSTVTLFRDYDIEIYTTWANEELMTVVQIESEEGMANLVDIVATPGVDAIMIGPADLSDDMGIPGQIHHPRMESAFREVIRQCDIYGVAPGIHLNNLDDVKKWRAEGMRFITYSYDTKFFKDASREALQSLRSFG
ncbi:HpcH/HpaI aldolase family protein [Pedobacter duraquae]|uniref:4-hydroxy-2-oxoheptanedioate aldolase n=1 Tax=Pedobacter duraquae TaxID=425511 RepID=A0A4R6IKI2_9SPHI|nr:aldolase/citrate lyase family protein [Pedobacter duraquae]TDO22531.1 4-hydroxy-2-oxoheptanedioate aldolase [Pedobacter duraquae]